MHSSATSLISYLGECFNPPRLSVDLTRGDLQGPNVHNVICSFFRTCLKHWGVTSEEFGPVEAVILEVVTRMTTHRVQSGKRGATQESWGKKERDLNDALSFEETTRFEPEARL